ncbi:MAG TPA: hypothetical protein RMH85_05490 [Polyangiaceae bacterium LLY-WYZ-15_(1-7)]|nr:hypothetical protein [Sandaracinus sp.]HJK91851.1 hypothetical protein [Polyangiaceae bacterium LLY-WYZ-15_(1-7)]HJL05309.1 hypothetical protein [Polyangiaceae bacterium LLY-WYZ-15_(1-7)]HJL07927.1 hypothetical protein [Polyangiaceae bacterium LLY-WYZ-15_(1-7)]HJL39422.1 hypothetical protein [Polyangiaceae bacterium LLY-WYZ-15_(1-7)]
MPSLRLRPRASGPALLAALLVAGAAGPAGAQRSFRDVAADAREVTDEEARSFAAPLFARCDEGDRSERRRCERTRRREARELRRTRWLLSVPATGHVESGPYEAVREGFLVRVPDLIFESGEGLLTTRAPEGGAIAQHVLAQRFFVVPPERAERWFSRNAVGRLRLRVVFRFGRAWESGERRGVVIEPEAIQVYNSSTGNVLVDSLREVEAPPSGPTMLDQRVLLWDAGTLHEARWRAPDGTPLLFSVRVERGAEGVQRPVLLEARGVDVREVARFEAPCCGASLALMPRNADGVLVVFTERRPSDGDPGRGVVRLYEWRGERLEQVAHWAGSNDQNPPAWIVDPSAPVPPSD